MEWQVLEENKSSLQFYRKMGGEVVPGWKDFRVERSAIEALANQEIEKIIPMNAKL